ncbi:MAG TPA: hypothetical protein VEB21_10850 [Terriglobales bacterium]|nr:hypothetical protein [Terriglobales bacterium]
MKTNQKMLLATAVAGMLAAAGQVAVSPAHAEGDKIKCYGANACKGQGACAGGGHGCGGKNGCKGQGFVEVESEEACLKMAGGRLTPEKK